MSRLAAFALVLAACSSSHPHSDGGMLPDGSTMPDGAMMTAPDGAMIAEDLAPACVPSPEVCNGKDDDCDGLVDEPYPGSSGTSVCDCTTVPATITVAYPDTVQAGHAAELQVQLHDGTGALIGCNPGIVFTSSDAAATPPYDEVMARYGGYLYTMALVTAGTQSITATALGTSGTRSNITVRGDDIGVAPSVTPIALVAPGKLAAIPSTNTFVDDFTYDGAVTLGDSLYFFASQGRGGKLFGYSVAGGVQQLSSTNPGGPDHQWTGGLRALGGSLYFDALDAGGCVKLYRYTPGDPMVTKPIYALNDAACTEPPTQLAAQPSDQSVLSASTLLGTGDDVQTPPSFSPILVNGLVYFAAATDLGYQLIELDPATGTSKPVSAIAGLDSLALVLGSQGTTVYFTDGGAFYAYTQGDAPVTTPTTSVVGTAPPATLYDPIVVGDTLYYLDGQLEKYTIGDAQPTTLSTTSGGTDAAADLVQIGTQLYFSSLDASADRRIYAYTIGDTTQVTAPIADPCGTGCTLASQPLGVLGTDLYFGARDVNRNLKLYRSPTTGGNATLAFTVNTTPSDAPRIAAAVGTGVYVLEYQGFLGEQLTGRYPNFAAQRSPTRFGWGTPELYWVPASGAAQQAFLTVTGDDDDIDGSGGIKAPSQFQVVDGTLYFVARAAGTGPSYTYHLYSHTPGQSGMTAVPIDSGIGIPPQLTARVVNGALYFVADVANDAASPEWKLFKHAPGDAAVTPANALSDLVPAGSDTITNLTDLGGTLAFDGADANGYHKIYKWAPGDAVVTTAAAVTNIVPGGDDTPIWNPTELAGGDASVSGTTLLFSSQGAAYKYTLGGAVVQASDALTATGSGDIVVSWQGAYYLVPQSAAVANGYYEGGVQLFDKPVQYVQVPVPLGSTGATAYERIPSTSIANAVEYVKMCTVQGPSGGAVDGVFYVMSYYAGTDTCGYVSITGGDDQYAGWSIPFPTIGGTATAAGLTAQVSLQHDSASDRTFVRGSLWNRNRRVNADKLYEYAGGALTMLSPGVAGQDLPSLVTLGAGGTYFTANACGGLVEVDGTPNAFSCPRAYRYVP